MPRLLQLTGHLESELCINQEKGEKDLLWLSLPVSIAIAQSELTKIPVIYLWRVINV
jgi:hypothetical protein